MSALDELRAAADGDKTMFTALAERALHGFVTDPRQAELALGQTLAFARLAAIGGGGIEKRRLAGVLYIQAEIFSNKADVAQMCDDPEEVAYFERECTDSQAEALYWLNAAADQGDSEAEKMIWGVAEAGGSPEVFAIASAVTANPEIAACSQA